MIAALTRTALAAADGAEAVLTWAVGAGVALAPAGAAGVAVLAPAGDPARGVPELPPDVRSALAADWPTVRAALDAALAALPSRDCYCWPSVPPALLTLVAWADLVRAGLDPDASEWWEERAAIYEADAGFPRWYAECQATEDVMGERPTCLAGGTNGLA